MDVKSWGFQYAAEKNTLPFEEIKQNMVKIKSIPIKLQWVRYGDTAWPVNNQAMDKAHSKVLGVEPTSQRWWFRSPPTVQEVKGILGHGPFDETRGGNLDKGEREVRDDSESEHRTASLLTHPQESIPCKSLPQFTNPKQNTSPIALHKFVGHLW